MSIIKNTNIGLLSDHGVHLTYFMIKYLTEFPYMLDAAHNYQVWAAWQQLTYKNLCAWATIPGDDELQIGQMRITTSLECLRKATGKIHIASSSRPRRHPVNRIPWTVQPWRWINNSLIPDITQECFKEPTTAIEAMNTFGGSSINHSICSCQLLWSKRDSDGFVLRTCGSGL